MEIAGQVASLIKEHRAAKGGTLGRRGPEEEVEAVMQEFLHFGDVESTGDESSDSEDVNKNKEDVGIEAQTGEEEDGEERVKEASTGDRELQLGRREFNP
jgi:hypothetical protein